MLLPIALALIENRSYSKLYAQKHSILTYHLRVTDRRQQQKGKKAPQKAKKKLIADLEKEMKEAAKVLDFERAMELRDIIMELKGEK